MPTSWASLRVWISIMRWNEMKLAELRWLKESVGSLKDYVVRTRQLAVENEDTMCGGMDTGPRSHLCVPLLL